MLVITCLYSFLRFWHSFCPDLYMKNRIWTVFSLLVVQHCFSQNTICFSPPQVFPNSFGPCRSLVTADFNNDGLPDFCTQSDGIFLLLSNGLGSYTFSSNITPGNVYIDAILTQDFNNDGDADVAGISSQDSSVFIFIGNGLGNMSSTNSFSVQSDSKSLIAADFNNDNKMDLATANYYTNTISIFLGNGNGSFLTAINYSVPNNTSLIIAGDFNNNAALDIFVFTSGSSVILKGTGNGTFSVTSNFTVQADAALTAKLNNDNYPDLVSVNGSTLSVRLGNGNYGFGSPMNYPLNGSSGSGESVTMADFNNDSKSDLAVTLNDRIFILQS